MPKEPKLEIVEEIGILGGDLSLRCCSSPDPFKREGIPSFLCEVERMVPEMIEGRESRARKTLEEPIKNILVNSFAGAQANVTPSLPRTIGSKEKCSNITWDSRVECDVIKTSIKGVEGSINELFCVGVSESLQ